MTLSASGLPYRDRDECGFHQAATAVVVIVRVGVKPKKDANQNATSPQKGELKHRQPKAELTLIRLIGLGGAFAGIGGDALLKLLPQGDVVHLLTDQHQLVFAFSIPIAVIDREAFPS